MKVEIKCLDSRNATQILYHFRIGFFSLKKIITVQPSSLSRVLPLFKIPSLKHSLSSECTLFRNHSQLFLLSPVFTLHCVHSIQSSLSAVVTLFSLESLTIFNCHLISSVISLFSHSFRKSRCFFLSL